VKKQYYVYDSNSCIADIGGYLGLCLGMSILTFYDMAVMLMAMTTGWIGKKRLVDKSKKITVDP
jgi:uncharacterized membrane protein